MDLSRQLRADTGLAEREPRLSKLQVLEVSLVSFFDCMVACARRLHVFTLFLQLADRFVVPRRLLLRNAAFRPATRALKQAKTAQSSAYVVSM